MSSNGWNTQGPAKGGMRASGTVRVLAPSGQPAKPNSATPTLSIQCFEGRHHECHGDCKPFADCTCGCRCHASIPRG